MIDFDKPITTRCGYPVEIWTTEARDSECYAVVGLINDGKKWFQQRWSIDGEWHAGVIGNDYDLINVPEEIEGWINIYKESQGLNYFFSRSKEEAEIKARENRIACIKVTFKEGEGI